MREVYRSQATQLSPVTRVSFFFFFLASEMALSAPLMPDYHFPFGVRERMLQIAVCSPAVHLYRCAYHWTPQLSLELIVVRCKQRVFLKSDFEGPQDLRGLFHLKESKRKAGNVKTTDDSTVYPVSGVREYFQPGYNVLNVQVATVAGA